MTDNTSTQVEYEEISGDGSLSFGDRWRYLTKNLVINLRAVSSGRLKAKPFNGQDIDVGEFIDIISSPSRALTDAFLKHELPTLLSLQNINVLDIGCGSGRLSDALAARGYHGTYTGIDLGDRFSHDVTYPNAFVRHFIHDSVHNLKGETQYDLIISVSALEHVNDDHILISSLNSRLTQDGLGVHFIPSGWGLMVYLWHGFRQYTIGSIEQKFGTNNVRVYGLGGISSLIMHFIFITLGEMLFKLPVRQKSPRLYNRALRFCLKLDLFMPYPPVMYVVCHQRPKIKAQNS